MSASSGRQHDRMSRQGWPWAKSSLSRMASFVGEGRAEGDIAPCTETEAPVHMVVGLGNAFVATGRRQRFSPADIDLLAETQEAC